MKWVHVLIWSKINVRYLEDCRITEQEGSRAYCQATLTCSRAAWPTLRIAETDFGILMRFIKELRNLYNAGKPGMLFCLNWWLNTRQTLVETSEAVHNTWWVILRNMSREADTPAHTYSYNAMNRRKPVIGHRVRREWWVDARWPL